MKKTALLILLVSANVMAADNVIKKEYNAKPMIDGNRRVDEIIEWSKNHPGEMPPLTEQEKNEFFIKQGIPLPGTGATVVDNTKGLKFTKSQTSFVNKFNLAQKTKGYYEKPNKKAKILLAMPEKAEKEYNDRKLLARSPGDTHLYEVLSDMPMKFNYKGVPANLATKVIGYAPEHTFINNGWTGAVEFFIPGFNSVCAYHEISIKLTKTSAYIPKEIATYAVNNKLTKINAMGDKDTGFVYEVEWWDQQFKRTLECASQNYSQDIAKATLELAKKIDS